MKSLVIVDPQNDFISGVLGSKEAQDVLPKIIEFVKNFDSTVIYTMDDHCEYEGETRELELLPKHCMRNTIGRLVPQELEVELEKKDAQRFMKDSFMPYEDYEDKSLSDGIYEIYDDNDVRFKNNTIYLCGYCTDICVLNTALYLRCYCPNDDIIILKDLCAGSSPELHEKALDVMKSNLIQVKESTEV